MSDAYDVEFTSTNKFSGASSLKTARVSANSKLEALAKFKQNDVAHRSDNQKKIHVINVHKRP